MFIFYYYSSQELMNGWPVNFVAAELHTFYFDRYFYTDPSIQTQKELGHLMF